MKSLSILITFNNPPPPHPQSTYTALAMYFFKKRVDKTYINFQDKQACIQHGTSFMCCINSVWSIYLQTNCWFDLHGAWLVSYANLHIACDHVGLQILTFIHISFDSSAKTSIIGLPSVIVRSWLAGRLTGTKNATGIWTNTRCCWFLSRISAYTLRIKQNKTV